MKKLIALFLFCLSVQAYAAGTGAVMMEDGNPSTVVAGVSVPGTAQVDRETLQLNGAGLRTKFFFKVYVGALYLDEKTHDAATVLTNTGAKRVAMYWKMDVDNSDIKDGFKEGFDANNTPAVMSTLAPQLQQFMAVFDKFRQVKEGEVINLDYVPGEGTRITLDGREMGRVAGADFYTALLRIWFGDHAVDTDLEKGMLGD